MKRPSPIDPDKLSDADVLELMKKERQQINEARKNLKLYGSTIAPTAGPRSKRPVDPKWFTTEKTCVHCGETKMVEPGFGRIFSRAQNKEYAAGWCKKCRAAENYRRRKARGAHPSGAPGT